MKKLVKLFAGALLILTGFASCEKEENKNYFEGGTAPVLTASVTGTIPLSFINKDNEAVKFTWTNPNYQFTTGISSQDVSYLVEIDTAGKNFTSANRVQFAISQSMLRSFTQSDFNDLLLNQLVLVPARTYNIEIRITSTLVNKSVPLTSNTLKFAVTPYAIPPKVAPPASGQLFIVGNATPGGDATGWNNPVPTPSQQFTKVSTTVYELTVALNAGKSYLFLPVNGSWTDKYGAIGGNGSNNVNGDDFRDGGGDLLSPAVGGNYKIQVDFQRGKFTVTKL